LLKSEGARVGLAVGKRAMRAWSKAGATRMDLVRVRRHAGILPQPLLYRLAN
jgi:hypothetical protein